MPTSRRCASMTRDVGAGVGGVVERLGQRQPVGADARRPPEAVERLGAAEIRVDEVALEMSGQHPRVGPRRAARPPHALDQPLEHLRRAGHRGRTEGRDAVTDQATGDFLDGVQRFERVEAFDAVDVDVDEAGGQRLPVQIDEPAAAAGGTRRSRPRLNFRDPAVLDDDRPGRQQPVWQDHVGAAQDQRPGEG
jgi:hypothetical protein